MIPKGVKRLSGKIMLKQESRARWWFNLIPSRSSNGECARVSSADDDIGADFPIGIVRP